jgi:hypothetical protein
MKLVVIQCDICGLQIKEPAAVIRLDYRNKPSNSGGLIGEVFHSCADCRTKLINYQYKVRDLVTDFLKSLKDIKLEKIDGRFVEVKNEPSK